MNQCMWCGIVLPEEFETCEEAFNCECSVQKDFQSQYQYEREMDYHYAQLEEEESNGN